MNGLSKFKITSNVNLVICVCKSILFKKKTAKFNFTSKYDNNIKWNTLVNIFYEAIV